MTRNPHAVGIIERPYPLPRAATGAQGIARQLLDRIAAWGHAITAPTYIEEQDADGHGRPLPGTAAFRVECTADGRRLVARFDLLAYGLNTWTLTTDDQPQEIPDLSGAAQMWQRLHLVALAAHRALSD